MKRVSADKLSSIANTSFIKFFSLSLSIVKQEERELFEGFLEIERDRVMDLEGMEVDLRMCEFGSEVVDLIKEKMEFV